MATARSRAAHGRGMPRNGTSTRSGTVGVIDVVGLLRVWNRSSRQRGRSAYAGYTRGVANHRVHVPSGLVCPEEKRHNGSSLNIVSALA